MIPYLGQVLLYLNLLTILISGVLCYLNKNLLARQTFFASFFLISTAFLILLIGFVETNYDFHLVMQNTHEMMPLIYRIAAVWGTHQGSMLLLIWMLATIYLILQTRVPLQETKIFLLIYLLFSIFLTFAANPFEINNDIIKVGEGFNPLLQDVAITFHPPILYLGNALQLIIFCLNVTSKNHSFISKLNKLSWTLITTGIALGSWWAYRELGWGGIWFWDPVENISLLPWLCSTALLHLNNVNKYKFSFKLFAFVGALSFCYGLIIVRSGLLTSVHSFAFDLSKGIYLLIIFIILLVIAVCNITIQRIKSSSTKIISKEAAVTLNNILLIIIFSIIIISTLYPLFMRIFWAREVVVEEKFFVASITPIVITILVAISYYSHILFKKSFLQFLLVIVFSGLALYLLDRYHPINSYIFKSIILLSFIIIFYSLMILLLEKRTLYMCLGHIFLGLLLLSITLHYSWSYATNLALKPQQPAQVRNFTVELLESHYGKKQNYLTREATIKISSNKHIFFLTPELRYFPIEKLFTVESSVHHYNIINDIYITAGEINSETLMLEFRYQACINLIWLSAALMASTGLLSYIHRKKNAKN